MSTILAEELKDLGIRVNVIGPGGFTDTGMALERDKEFRKKNSMPILEPTVLNKVISFLASPASAGIYGQKMIGKDFDEWLEEKGIIFE